MNTYQLRGVALCAFRPERLLLQGLPFRCWGRQHGREALSRAFIHSIDVNAVEIMASTDSPVMVSIFANTSFEARLSCPVLQSGDSTTVLLSGDWVQGFWLGRRPGLDGWMPLPLTFVKPLASLRLHFEKLEKRLP